MPETIIRLFERPEHAKAAMDELVRAGVPASDTSLIASSPDRGGVFDALVRLGANADEARTFAEALPQDGALVCARVDESRLEGACAAIDSVPFLQLGPRRAAYQVSGHAQADETPLSAEQIAHDRAR